MMNLLVATGVLLLLQVSTSYVLPSHHNNHRTLLDRSNIGEKWMQFIKAKLHDDPEVHYNMSQLVTSQGYPVEIHDVETEDGYILGVYRIPHGRNITNSTDKPVVFVQHGLLASSTNWVTNLPYEALGFILADAGFDVWMGNSRGNTYSLKHKKYNPKEKEFWAFSWDEMVQYDLPAVFNYIGNATGKADIYYVGHSQGTVQAFALFSKNQEIASRIKMFFALAPITTLGHIKSPIRLMSDIPDKVLFDVFGRKDFLPNSKLIDILADTLCKNNKTRFVCDDIIFLLCGFDISNLNQSRLPVYMSHTPAGTSVQNMIHYSQMVRTNAFQMFNYDSKEENIKHYGQDTPPLYNVSKMETPVALFTGGHDWLADPKDVAALIPRLRNIKQHVNVPTYNHLDFIWGMDAYKHIYNVIVDMIKVDSAM